MSRMASIEDVKAYWNTSPLLSFELASPGSVEFFEHLDEIKKTDIEKFAMHYWAFDSFQGKKVLDVGCGPGWITVSYASQGAEVTAIDLTDAAVALTRKNLERLKLKANVQQGNAESIEFSDNSFDLVVSSGVLHHTPNTYKAIQECYRVCKPGGTAKITLYHKGLLLRKPFFPLTRMIMRLGKVGHPGAKSISSAGDMDDFVRTYDGAQNPVGIAKSTGEWTTIFEKVGFRVLKHELHYFPKRFLPFLSRIPNTVHFYLDKFFGTMIYFELAKVSVFDCLRFLN